MALSKTQEALLTKLRAVGGGELGIALNDEICSYLLAVVVHDLGLQSHFPEVNRRPPLFFGRQQPHELRLAGVSFLPLYERLLELQRDGDAYFYCLGALHKARLKYDRILQAQPIPTIDQVGPRGLLQYGTLSPAALAGLLLWRKWIYDIDNRAAQETGYIFEPIIAYAIGGISASAQKSPVRRGGSGSGRQVDCLLATGKRAYEIKLRVTIAASGQGRWQEELAFPGDCRGSGYTPVLLVLDPTPNPKLTELCAAFKKHRGHTYVGEDAWKHLEQQAGPTMGTFLDKYVREPIQALLRESPAGLLPRLLIEMVGETIHIRVADEELEVPREAKEELASGSDELPPDAEDEVPLP